MEPDAPIDLNELDEEGRFQYAVMDPLFRAKIYPNNPATGEPWTREALESAAIDSDGNISLPASLPQTSR